MGHFTRRRRPVEGRVPRPSSLVAALVDELVLPDPGHHRAQLLAHLLDGVLGEQAPARLERRGPGAVLEDEVAGVAAGLDVGEARPSSPASPRAPITFGPGQVLAELRVVRDRVVHVGDAALVDEVDDELGLVQALEVGHLRARSPPRPASRSPP